jgi:hypothetical protein
MGHTRYGLVLCMGHPPRGGVSDMLRYVAKRLLIRSLIAISFIVVGVPCRGEGVPCWAHCRHPPEIHDAADVGAELRSTSNPKLNFLAHSTGILTTYLGKMLGIQGWHNYHMDARVSGNVTHASGSDDGFYTIDIAIDGFVVDGQPATKAKGRFIRVEMLPWVRPGAPLPVGSGDPVCILGGLWWDADGFLEIHPRKSADMKKGLCP